MSQPHAQSTEDASEGELLFMGAVWNERVSRKKLCTAVMYYHAVKHKALGTQGHAGFLVSRGV